MGRSNITDTSVSFLIQLMLHMGGLPPSYPSTLEPLLGILYILASLSSNIDISLPLPLEVEERRYGNGYFVHVTLVWMDGGRDPSVIGVVNVNARRLLS